MGLTIKKHNKLRTGVEAASNPRAFAGSKPKVFVDPKQVEVFGRLRLSTDHMAQYYGISSSAMAYHLSKPEVREAYDRGRAGMVIAVRQKQVQVAMGYAATYNAEGKLLTPAAAPDRALLMYVGRHLADQTETAEVNVTVSPGRSWADVVSEKAREVRARLAPIIDANPDEVTGA